MFIVSELTKEHHEPVSLLKTNDLFIALADLLLKGKKPFGLPQRRLGELDPYYSVFEQFYIQTRIGAMLTTYDRQTHKKLTLTVFQQSNKLRDPIHNTLFHDSTYPRYKNPKYESALQITASKIRAFSGGNIENALILVASASRNPKHIFWPQKDWLGRDVFTLG